MKRIVTTFILLIFVLTTLPFIYADGLMRIGKGSTSSTYMGRGRMVKKHPVKKMTHRKIRKSTKVARGRMIRKHRVKKVTHRKIRKHTKVTRTTRMGRGRMMVTCPKCGHKFSTRRYTTTRKYTRRTTRVRRGTGIRKACPTANLTYPGNR